MSESVLLWMEVIFDLLYLSTIWVFVVLMIKNRANLILENRQIGKLFTFAFFLLAFGDTGHVGFRVLAYGLGGLEKNPVLVGSGALATAVTVTFFYMLIAEIWRLRFNRKKGLIWWTLIVIGLLRLGIMAFPQNQWGNVVPPSGFSLFRNIPLMIQGMGVAILMLVDSLKYNDKFVKMISIMIFISYLCYTPVILFIQKIPMLGMLMMPKTLAYVAVAIIAYSLFRKKD